MTDSSGVLPDFDMTGVEHLGFDDVRGPATFRNLPEELQRQLDQTQADDWERRSWRPSVYRDRPASDAEKFLLSWLGFDLERAEARPVDADDDSDTHLIARVRYTSGSVRRVDFPQLADQLEALR
ncbi:hypothetical protein [Mycolicibacterium vanbaalenii]|uniref:Uncharacterized protein n=1 Tax=Mycolicibacterium vanbaalenii (strain DSM 7251 / JCM 13017 / BCRC 16820 / KCTC 9966 / NRRL B-24157 / PYR-1) TaxID=350058 RepID=A1T827_MYCVP|nr:hypothetical protein [Mycolicibacterium vanbaalenii]ABM13327.1 hypothetical protein Mvan_2516 [Mycolicibacterium vanbaalenii PYR-1]MCV7126830.1 hypothetical protein [Mycolicibacterium vanbaalenii PYR-1]